MSHGQRFRGLFAVFFKKRRWLKNARQVKAWTPIATQQKLNSPLIRKTVARLSVTSGAHFALYMHFSFIARHASANLGYQLLTHFSFTFTTAMRSYFELRAWRCDLMWIHLNAAQIDVVPMFACEILYASKCDLSVLIWSRSIHPFHGYTSFVGGVCISGFACNSFASVDAFSTMRPFASIGHRISITLNTHNLGVLLSTRYVIPSRFKVLISPNVSHQDVNSIIKCFERMSHDPFICRTMNSSVQTIQTVSRRRLNTLAKYIGFK